MEEFDVTVKNAGCRERINMLIKGLDSEDITAIV